jgi:polyhydroxybutyrate depolymerase
MHGWRLVRAVIAATAITVTLACGSAERPEPEPSPAPTTALPVSGTGTVEIGGRQVTVHVPDTYDPARPAPLVILLHGYGSDAREQEAYFRLTPESDRRGFVYVVPNGSVNDQGRHFWNATDACCAFAGPQPDDSRYLSELISTIQGAYRTDRVYLAGHSNGGFMALRMACDHAGQVTAVASLNGAAWTDAAKCRPSEPVSVLAIHSTDDRLVTFDGGALESAGYPSAAATLAQWRDHNGCAGAGREDPALDLVPGLPGAETTVRGTACAGQSEVRAWTINGGSHIPMFGPGFAPAMMDFLMEQK